MNRLQSYIINLLCMEKSYSALFKAGIILVSTALLAMYQVGAFLYEKDIAAHKDKFVLETSIRQPLEKVDCTKTGALQVDCLVAKHEMQTLTASFKLLNTVVEGCLLLSVLFTMLSGIGFLFAPFVKTTEEQPMS